MTPETEAALADAVRTANAPLAIQGGGTRGFTPDGEKLSVSALSGISLYEPGALTIVAQAGTPIAQINTALAAENQRLAFEPMDHRVLLGTTGEPTLGGVVAANVSGPRRIQGGAARDYALGVRYVDGTGAIIKNGGRVMKNVTGYDLVKLLSGAFGTLGILTEVALKVLPDPETEGTMVIHGLTDRGAVRAMAVAMASPYEVTGAAHRGTRTFLRVEGFEASVIYRLNRLKELRAGAGGDIDMMTAARSAEVWQGLRDVTHMRDLRGDIWRVCCKPSEAPALAARSGAQSWMFDWAGGLIWLRMPEGGDLRKGLARFDGHATLMRGSAVTRKKYTVFHPEAPGVAKITAGLRQRFDPRGILNAGLMGPIAARPGAIA